MPWLDVVLDPVEDVASSPNFLLIGVAALVVVIVVVALVLLIRRK